MAKKDFSTAAERVTETINTATAAAPETTTGNQGGGDQGHQEGGSSGGQWVKPETMQGKLRRPKKTYTAEELDQYRAQGRTRGRSGCYAHRYNMAFSDPVYDYITTMSRHLGLTMTQFTDLVFAQSMELNKELYERVKAMRSDFTL